MHTVRGRPSVTCDMALRYFYASAWPRKRKKSTGRDAQLHSITAHTAHRPRPTLVTSPNDSKDLLWKHVSRSTCRHRMRKNTSPTQLPRRSMKEVWISIADYSESHREALQERLQPTRFRSLSPGLQHTHSRHNVLQHADGLISSHVKHQRLDAVYTLGRLYQVISRDRHWCETNTT